MASQGFLAARGALAVTPHASNPIGRGACNALFVGGAGTITCRFVGESADTLLTGVVAGSVLPIQITHVRVTGTTATNMVAFY